MTYLEKFYSDPCKKACKKWKLLGLSTGIEVVCIILAVLIVNATYRVMDHYMQKLADNNLSDYVTFVNNLPTYNQEIQAVLYVLIFGSIICIVVLFLLYTLSRSFIWGKILNMKPNYWKNGCVHGIFFIVVLGIILFVAQFLRQEVHATTLALFMTPLIYYGFHCNLQLKKPRVRKVFKAAWSPNVLYILPHTVILLLVGKVLSTIVIGSLIYLVFLNFYRLFVAEIIHQ